MPVPGVLRVVGVERDFKVWGPRGGGCDGGAGAGVRKLVGGVARFRVQVDISDRRGPREGVLERGEGIRVD